MVNHGCHPTGLGPQAVISSDYPGVMRQALTDRGVADVVMFLQGAAGNLKQGAQVGDQIGWIGRPEDVQVLGSLLADSVAAAVQQTTKISGPIKAMSQPVVLPLKGTPVDSRVFESPENARVPRPILEAWASVAKDRYPAGAKGFEVEVGAVALGPAVFVATRRAYDGKCASNTSSYGPSRRDVFLRLHQWLGRLFSL